METVAIGSGLILLIILVWSAYTSWDKGRKELRQVHVGAVFIPCYGDDNPFTRKEQRRVVEEIREDHLKFGVYVDGDYKQSDTMKISSFLFWHYYLEG